MEFYQLKIEKVLEKLKTNLKNGLTTSETTNRLKQYGPNTLPEKNPPSAFIIFAKQFLSPLMFILLLASVISILIGEVTDAIVISIAVTINVIIGFIQEFKAEKSAQALKAFEVANCYVRRDEKIVFIEAKDLVPGDIVLLSAGTRVPADIRLTHVIDFQVEEAILTGEAKPIKKHLETIEEDVPAGDRINMAFSGTYVLSGKAEGVVVTTGSNTHLGQIAELVSETKKESTPLQKQIKMFSWWLGLIFISVTAIVFFLGLIKGMPFYQIIMISIALAVAAIPEGLLVAVTVILAIGMQRMLKRHALVRNLIAAETLGSVSVICTDKTGTLTQGHMQVVRIATKNFDINVADLPNNVETMEDKYKQQELKEVLIDSALNNDAQLQQDSKKPVGHPTEIALLQAADNLQINVEQIRKKFERIDEIPFSSDLKYMVTIHKTDGNTKLIVKGAPEKIFNMCNQQDPNLKKLKELSETMTKEGLRTLAIATKQTKDKDLSNLEFLGLLGIKDPLRTQAVKTVKELKSAGINVVLVTGDHKETAANIAKNAEINHRENGIMTGAQLDETSDKELAKKIQGIDIFARVDPRHKIRIVKAWQAHEKSVAMIGDGVNDAPALKAADIGVALGSGSDVAHEISDVVLLDDNLSTIDAAVKEGRIIFDNIRKVIVYLMVDSFGEIILISLAMLFNLPLPILAAQILWINLISDGLPYMALTMEAGEPEIMKEPPRPKNESIVNKEMMILIFGVGIITDIILFILYLYLLKTNLNYDHIRTIMFTTLAVNSIVFAFFVRSFRKPFYKVNFFSNAYLILAAAISLLVQLSVVYIPTLQNLFSTVSLSLMDWLIIIPLSGIKAVAIEITKVMFIKRDRS